MTTFSKVPQMGWEGTLTIGGYTPKWESGSKTFSCAYAETDVTGDEDFGTTKVVKGMRSLSITATMIMDSSEDCAGVYAIAMGRAPARVTAKLADGSIWFENVWCEVFPGDISGTDKRTMSITCKPYGGGQASESSVETSEETSVEESSEE